MNPRILDAALGVAIVLAIAGTMLLFLAARGPSVEVRNVTIRGVQMDLSNENHI